MLLPPLFIALVPSSSSAARLLGFSCSSRSSFDPCFLCKKGSYLPFQTIESGTYRRRSIRLIRPLDHIVDELMESKGGKKSSTSSSLQYEAPLGYSIEDVRPHGGIKKFQSAAYSNCVRKPS